MHTFLLSLFHDVPAGEQHPSDALLSPAELLAGLLEIGDGLARGVVLLAAALGFGVRSEVR
jgi:hypothetical protein